ncbi:S9 family peptidase, partial [Flavobacteriaceae bacterium PRS1]
MKKIIATLCFLVLIVSCKKDQETKDIALNLKQYTIEQFMDNESVFGGSFSPDNSKLLVTSNRTGIYNMYTVSAKDGKFTPITTSDSSSIFAVSYFPNDERMLFSADGNGDEINHLFLRDFDGSITDLTPNEGAKSSFYGWAENEKSFFYGSNKRDPKYFDVYKMSIDDFVSELIYQNNDGLNFSGISGDEQQIALSKSLNTSDSDLFVYNLKTKEKIKVNDNISANSAQAFSKDSSMLYYTTDDGAEFSYLMTYDLNTREKKKVLEKSWDISGIVFTNNGAYMVVYVNEDGKNIIEVIDVETQKPIDLPDFDGKSITSVTFSNDETMMRLYAGGSNSPSDLYVYNLETKELIKLTNVLNDAINAEDLVTAKVIRFKSFDGTEIPAIYYLPHQASAENKVPAMVWVHGGPGGQSRQGFNSLIQYMVNHGYAVLA